MRRILILSVLLLTTVSEARAEEQLWRCRSGDGKTWTFTNTPVMLDGGKCERENFPKGAYNKVSAETFAGFGGYAALAGSVDERGMGRKSKKEREEGVSATKAKQKGKKLKKKKAPKKKLKKEKKRKVAAAKIREPEVSWEFQDLKVVGSNDKERSFDSSCLVKGSAAGAGPKKARLLIRRGGATVDELPVQLKSNFKAVNWKTELPGACREPEVELR